MRPGCCLARGTRQCARRLRETAGAGECEAAQPLDPILYVRRHSPLKLSSELGAQGFFALNILPSRRGDHCGTLEKPKPFTQLGVAVHVRILAGGS